MELVQVKIKVAGKKVGEIEQGIRVVKEQARSVIANLLFTSLHKKIMIHLIYFMVMWFNAFLSTQGI